MGDYKVIYQDELNSEYKKKCFNILRENAGSRAKNNGAFSFTIEDERQIFQAAIEGYCYYGCCYIDLLAVEEDSRGKGYGSELMQKSEELARKRGCLFMAVNMMDFEAKPFYEKHGFTVEFVRKGFEKDSEMYFLRKAL